MNTRHLALLASLSLTFLPVAAQSAGAATATGALNATASVSAKCIVSSTTNVAFGNIDPTTNANYDGSGSIVTKCSKNTLEFIFVAPTVGTALVMKSPTTNDSITYALYSDAARTTAFPSVMGGTKVTQPGTPVVTTLYGRVIVASGVNDTIAAATDYIQALTATIEW
jgi:spore coat protein U-like protein